MKKVCHICRLNFSKEYSKKFPELEMTIDHIILKVLGGSNSKNNLASAHKFCNNTRGHKLLTEELKIDIMFKLLSKIEKYKKHHKI